MSKKNRVQLDKLVKWDADFYKSLSDDDCIICLSEREIYLVGQVFDQLRWGNTRWAGDKSGLDFDLIASNLEYKLAERMTCEKLSDISQIINQLQITVSQLQTTVNNIANPGSDTVVTEDTQLNIALPSADATAFSTDIDVCDDDGKSALYGACVYIVNYINQSNIDFLEQLTQATGNLAQQSNILLEAFPPTDILAVDSVAKYIGFLIDELLDEYNATVTQELLQTTMCDLFCIAVSNDCTLTLYDICNYFGGKVDPTFANFATTFANLVEFASIGTFSGDMYFHYMCYFNLVSVALGQGIGLGSAEDFQLQLLAGQNNPDGDWELLCDECPTFHRLWTWNFSGGMGDFTFINLPGGTNCAVAPAGILDGSSLKGVRCGSQNTIGIIMPFNPAWRVRSVRMTTRRENGIGNGTYDYATFKMRPAANSDSGSFNPIGGGFRPNGTDILCEVQNTTPPYYWTGANQIFIAIGVAYDDSPVSAIYLDEVEILFNVGYEKLGSVAVVDDNLCA